MKPLPPGLPAASSSSWHSRRARDGLGYLRSRSLANPAWQRDMPWLISYLRRTRPPAGEPLRPCYEAAITAARRYQRLAARGAPGLDGAWDEVLAPIDEIVVARHREHLDHVAEAGVSGDQVPGTTIAGLSAARARGKTGGRPYTMTPAKIRLAAAAMSQRDTSASHLCAELGISRQTLYRYISPTGDLRPDAITLLAKAKTGR